MKKYLIPILLFIMFIPFMVNAETCDTSSITIDSINVDNISGNAEELSSATISGKKINLDLKLYDPGDSIEYTLSVKNTSSEDFYFDEESLKLNTDYIEYEFSYDDNSNMSASSLSLLSSGPCRSLLSEMSLAFASRISCLRESMAAAIASRAESLTAVDSAASLTDAAFAFLMSDAMSLMCVA